MASPKFSKRTAKLNKTTSSCALPLTKLTLSDKLHDLPGLNVLLTLLSPQTPRDRSRLWRCESQHQSDLWDRSEGPQGCTQQKNSAVVFFPGSSPVWENIFGVALWRTPCDAFSPATQTWQVPVWQWEMLLGMPQCCWRDWQWEGDEKPYLSPERPYLSPVPLACDWT